MLWPELGLGWGLGVRLVRGKVGCGYRELGIWRESGVEGR